jgi:hypothetical protein
MKAFLATTLALAAPVLADDEQTVPATPQENLPVAESTFPPPSSNSVPAPTVAAPTVEPTVVEQTAVTEDVGYARRGVFEVGAHAGMMLAPGFRNVNISPMLGWFVSDNIELSAIAGVSNIKAGDQSTTVWSALIEPSYHMPLGRTTFGFFGAGVGAAYVSGLGPGVAVTPRIGAKVLVGRSGVLTPSLSYEYTSHNGGTEEEMENITRAAVSSAIRINIGYTAMW